MSKLFRVVAVFFVLAGFLISTLGQVSGQSNALAIAPRKDYNLKPGESVQDTLTVTNQNKEEPLNLDLKVVDFEAADETGTPKLLRTATERTAWSVKNFIELPQQITINPGETVRIPISIHMPDDVGAGSYYSAIEYAAVNPTTDEQVNIAASSVTLVFVNVPGQAKQQLTLLQFGAFVAQGARDGQFKGLYFGERPKVLSYRLRNDGNVAEQPSGSILVKDFSGKVVYEISNANPKSQLALRGQTRRFDACINPENITATTETGQDVESIQCGDTEKLKPGRYTAELAIAYTDSSNGNETREITAKATFWYLPWWFVGVVVVALAVIAGVIIYIWRRVQDVRSRKTRRR